MAINSRYLLRSCKSRQIVSFEQRRFMGTWPKMYPKRVRVITCDVTGTLVSFRGSLEEHYLGSAKKYGVDLPKEAPIGKAFRKAYKEVSQEYPCFGGHDLTAKEWWKKCVLRSFEYAGCHLNGELREIVFQRIYSLFGSQAAYEKFNDTLPFLQWARRHNIVCGVISNADERYGDSILPMLGLTLDDLQFQCYSKDHLLEKPDGRFYFAALKEASNWLDPDNELHPSEVLHIGNDYAKDFEGARRVGMHAVLLERYNNKELAAEWSRRGAMVFEDLIDVVEFLGRSRCQLG